MALRVHKPLFRVHKGFFRVRNELPTKTGQDDRGRGGLFRPSRTRSSEPQAVAGEEGAQTVPGTTVRNRRQTQDGKSTVATLCKSRRLAPLRPTGLSGVEGIGFKEGGGEGPLRLEKKGVGG